jgi:hypothetical protein
MVSPWLACRLSPVIPARTQRATMPRLSPNAGLVTGLRAAAVGPQSGGRSEAWSVILRGEVCGSGLRLASGERHRR